MVHCLNTLHNKIKYNNNLLQLFYKTFFFLNKVCFQGMITCTEIFGILNFDARTLDCHADECAVFSHLGIADCGEKPNIIIHSSHALGRAEYLGSVFPVSQFVLSCLLNCHAWHGWTTLKEGNWRHVFRNAFGRNALGNSHEFWWLFSQK